jgi:hypothetical protein
MEFKDIDKIIQKYFDGESTLQEEIIIRRFLLKAEGLPEKYDGVRRMFLFFDSEHKKTSNLQFDSILPKQKSGKKIIRMTYFAVAASIALVFGIWFMNRSTDEKKIFAYINGKPVENKEIAYKEAQKALLLVSKSFNKGTENLKQISEFDRTLKMINKNQN